MRPAAVFFSNDEDNFDAAGDVAKSGMNGVCARPIGPSDLLYGGTTTYCICCNVWVGSTLLACCVWGGKGGIGRAATLTGHHRHRAVQSSSSSSFSLAPLQSWPSAPYQDIYHSFTQS